MLLQIKDLLHQRSPGALASDLGPLAEMEFWRRRNEDLQGLCRQISSPGTCLQICHSIGPLRGRFLRGMSIYYSIVSFFCRIHIVAVTGCTSCSAEACKDVQDAC